MKKIILAAAAIASMSTAAFADSSILDVQNQNWNQAPVYTDRAVDYTATASTGMQEEFEIRDRLGDGSPQYLK